MGSSARVCGWHSSTRATWRSAPRVAISGSFGCRARATARRIINAGHGCPHRNGPRSRQSSRPRPGSPSTTNGPSGVHLCLGEAEIEARHALMERMRVQSGNFGFDYRIVDRRELTEMLPGLGPAVSGASWTPYDGHANPLSLLHALHKGFAANGGRYLPNSTVTEAGAAPGDFRIPLAGSEISAPKVVLAAGLGNADLARHFGLSAPVRPLKGQILVTERARQVLPMPITTIRQTAEGSFMLGDSQEDAGFDTSQRPAVMQTIARRAVLSFPWLRDLQIVRAWAALRIMPPDGLPIYDQSEQYPGAFTANCHSGVTLAGAHANLFAPMVAAGTVDPALEPLSSKRFDVSAAA